jgi:acetyl-CoA acetyltransferase family protein
VNDAFICDAIRTPIGRYGGALAQVRADDLAAIPLRALKERNPGADFSKLDDVILGCANQAGEDNRNVARMAVLLAGLGDSVPGITINRLCGSGMDAVAMAARAIKADEGDFFIAGGIESMTRAPFVMGKQDSAFGRKAEMYDTTIGWRFVNKRLKDEFGIDSMPETAENVAGEFQVSREEQDRFAAESQRRAAEAQANGRLAAEIAPVSIPQRKGDPVIVDRDEHPRDTSVETLAKLKPIVKPDGTVTAGNASGVNDGAAAILVASEEAVEKHGLKPRARVLGAAVAGAQASRRFDRRRTCEPQRRRNRTRSPPWNVRRPAGPNRDRGASAARRKTGALHDVHRGRAGNRSGARTGVDCADGYCGQGSGQGCDPRRPRPCDGPGNSGRLDHGPRDRPRHRHRPAKGAGYADLFRLPGDDRDRAIDPTCAR